jgi:hypothetical protein
MLLADEKSKHPNAKDRSVTSGLMWLLRGLKFTAIGELPYPVDRRADD